MSNFQVIEDNSNGTGVDPTWVDAGDEPSFLRRGAEAILDNGMLIVFMGVCLYAMYAIFMAGIPGTSISGACQYQLERDRPLPRACRQFGYESTDAPN